ncbi:hypothetical protein FJZ26_06300, partial [Candidatus Parvarchaeota archaeon]|nr:hypothetical protein [Candidatus Parvarchaeota archaeon]
MLKGTLDMAKSAFQFDAYFKTPPTFDLGIMSLGSPSVTFSNKTGLSMKAQASLLDLVRGNITLERFSVTPKGNEILLSFAPTSPFDLYLSPWKKVTINKLFVFLSAAEKRLFTQINLASAASAPDTTITFGMSKTDSYAELSIDDMKMEELFESLKDDALGDVSLKSCKVRVTNPFDKKAKHTVTISSLIDLSPLKDTLPSELNLKGLTADAIIEIEARNLQLKTALTGGFEIFPGCNVVNPAFALAVTSAASVATAGQATASVVPDKAAVGRTTVATLSGKIDWEIPGGLGKIKGDLCSYFKD